VRAAEPLEVEQRSIGEMRRRYVLQAAKQAVRAARILLLPTREHGFDLAPLHVLLRAAEVARNDRETAAARIARDVTLRAIRERADHDVLTVIALQLRRHRLQARAVEHVEEQRLDDVVAVVPQRDLRSAELVGDAIENAAPQARAQAAHRLAGLYDARD